MIFSVVHIRLLISIIVLEKSLNIPIYWGIFWWKIFLMWEDEKRWLMLSHAHDFSGRWIIPSSYVNQSLKITRSSYINKYIIHDGQNMSKQIQKIKQVINIFCAYSNQHRWCICTLRMIVTFQNLDLHENVM